jgi:hypothetical protein
VNFVLKEKELSPGINLSDEEQMVSVDEHLAMTLGRNRRPSA